MRQYFACSQVQGQPGLYFPVLTSILLIFLLSGCNPATNGEGKGDPVFRPERWSVVDEPALGFRARFPGAWSHQLDYFQTEKGLGTVHIYSYWHVAFQYGITVLKLPPGLADKSQATEALDHAVKSLAEEFGGLVAYQEPLMLGGYPARRAMILLPDSFLKNARINTLIVLRENYIYRVSTSGIGNLEFVDHFLNSFEIIPFE